MFRFELVRRAKRDAAARAWLRAFDYLWRRTYERSIRLAKLGAVRWPDLPVFGERLVSCCVGSPGPPAGIRRIASRSEALLTCP
jgi:hypothetical protein